MKANRGVTAFGLGHGKEAADYFLEAAELEPEDERALTNEVLAHFFSETTVRPSNLRMSAAHDIPIRGGYSRPGFRRRHRKSRSMNSSKRSVSNYGMIPRLMPLSAANYYLRIVSWTRVHAHRRRHQNGHRNSFCLLNVRWRLR